MASRLILKKGDIFEVPLQNGSVRYFQYLMNDLTQLNSDVIRVFNLKEKPLKENIQKEILDSGIDFYVHCSIRIGYKMNLWHKIGHIKIEPNHEIPIFRDTNDYGNQEIKVSKIWHAWKPNENFVKIGELTDETRKYDIGLVINPNGVMELLKGNKYPPLYPD